MVNLIMATLNRIKLLCEVYFMSRVKEEFVDCIILAQFQSLMNLKCRISGVATLKHVALTTIMLNSAISLCSFEFGCNGGGRNIR